jgi:soluble lytic murein transglycosylase
MRPPLLALALALLAGCSERRFAGPPPVETAAAPCMVAADSASAIAEFADAGPPSAGEEATWRDAVRLERWVEAAARIDLLPEDVRTRPDMRYVRARAAVGSGDGARAVALLDGLEPALPLLTADIARWRAEAQSLDGPFAPAAAYFARSGAARDLTRAADAYERAGDGVSARAAADRAVAAASRSRSAREEAAARAKRAEIALAHGGEAGNAGAEADLRWAATHAASSAEGRAAAATLERMKRPPPRVAMGPPPPNAAERAASLDGADAADAGAGAAPPVERSVPAPVVAVVVPRGEGLHARAMALFHARDYEAAAGAFRDAVAGKSGHEAEDLHFAGRSLARADRDEDAAKTYRDVVQRYPRSPFAEKSAYQAARLMLQGGHFKEAAQAYTRYLTTYRRGEHRDEAEYERALAWLSAGDGTGPGPRSNAASARKELEALAGKAHDDRGARLRELAALAADRAGDRAAAVATWTDLARHQPLTWAALTSRARLASVGAALPPRMEPEPAGYARASGARLDLRLPPAPALLTSLGLDGDAESRLSSEEREASAPYAGREGEALCGLYGLLTRAKRRYRVGINAVEGSLLTRTPSATERWAWDCVYPRPFAAGVRALEEQHELPRGIVYAVMRQESGFDPAIVSPASAVGLMQLMPATAKQAASELSLPFDEADLTRPDVNLRLGAFYIAKLLRMFQGNVALAAAAYNAGPRAVSRWLSASPGEDLDLWVARIPFDETRNYVARVAQNLARYQWLEGGDDAVTELALPIPTDARASADAY